MTIVTYQRKWNENYSSLMNHWNIYKRRTVVDKKKYYGGFKVEKDKTLFEEELKDLEDRYVNNIKDLKESICNITPDVIFYMKNFIKYHEQLEETQEKLDDLRYKRKGEEDL